MPGGVPLWPMLIISTTGSCARLQRPHGQRCRLLPKFLLSRPIRWVLLHKPCRLLPKLLLITHPMWRVLLQKPPLLLLELINQPFLAVMAPQGRQGHKDLPEKLEPQGRRGLREKLEPQGHKDLPEKLEPQGRQDLREKLEPQGRRGHKDQLESQDSNWTRRCWRRRGTS